MKDAQFIKRVAVLLKLIPIILNSFIVICMRVYSYIFLKLYKCLHPTIQIYIYRYSFNKKEFRSGFP